MQYTLYRDNNYSTVCFIAESTQFIPHNFKFGVLLTPCKSTDDGMPALLCGAAGLSTFAAAALVLSELYTSKHLWHNLLECLVYLKKGHSSTYSVPLCTSCKDFDMTLWYWITLVSQPFEMHAWFKITSKGVVRFCLKSTHSITCNWLQNDNWICDTPKR